MDLYRSVIFGAMLLFLFLFSCSTETTGTSHQKSGKISFSFTQEELQLRNGDAPRYVVISVSDGKGEMVLSDYKIELIAIGESYITEPLELDGGMEYRLMTFFVLNENSEGLYATPVVDSELSDRVTKPLPMSFFVNSDEVHKIIPEVLSIGGLSAEDFGYASFSFKIVKKSGIMISLFMFDPSQDNFVFTSGNVVLTSLSDQMVMVDTMIQDSVNIIPFTRPQDKHTIEVIKMGFESYIDTFTSEELKEFSMVPLKIILNKDGNTNEFLPFKKTTGTIVNSHFVTSDNVLWGVGRGIGNGTSEVTVQPKKIMDNVKFVMSVDQAFDFTFIVTLDSKLYFIFDNGGAPLFVMDNVVDVAFQWISSSATRSPLFYVLKNDGKVFYVEFTDVITEIVKRPITPNDYIELFITDNGQSISSNKNSMMILKNDFSLWGKGVNEYGQFGIGSMGDTVKEPRLIMENVTSMDLSEKFSLVLKKDNTVWASGDNSTLSLGFQVGASTDNKFVKILEEAQFISAEKEWAFFIKKDHSLWGSGKNIYGQLGVGDEDILFQPTKIMDDIFTVGSSDFHSIFVKNDGTYWSCGRNDIGQLGDGTSINRRVPVQIIF